MSFLAALRRTSTGVAAPSVRAFSTNAFSTTPLAQRIAISYEQDTRALTYKVLNQKQQSKVRVVGRKDSQGNYLRPEFVDPEIRQVARSKTAKEMFARDDYSMRKRYLSSRYEKLFDSAPLVVCVQPLQSTLYDDFRRAVSKHFKSLHVTNGLVRVEGKRYEQMKMFFKGPTKVLYLTNHAELFPAIKALYAALKAHPNMLFLGGSVEGSPAVSYSIEELLQFTSKEQIQGSIIPYLNSPAQVIPVLQSSSMQLTRLLNHHAETLQKGQGGGGDGSSAAPPS